MFESSVNSEGIETYQTIKDRCDGFESSVNSEGIETIVEIGQMFSGLRAV